MKVVGPEIFTEVSPSVNVSHFVVYYVNIIFRLSGLAYEIDTFS